MRKSVFVPVLWALGALVAGVAVAQYLFLKPSPVPGAVGTTVPVVAGQFGGDFRLTQAGQSIALSDFAGKVVVLYFGYASCPDICPTSLGIISSALKALTPQELTQVQPIFISVDPERDNGEKLTTYATYFHPGFLGVTGTPEEIQAAAKQYGVFFNKVQSTSAMGYSIDHTSTVYIVSKDGKSVRVVGHDMDKASVLESIRQAL